MSYVMNSHARNLRRKTQNFSISYFGILVETRERKLGTTSVSLGTMRCISTLGLTYDFRTLRLRKFDPVLPII